MEDSNRIESYSQEQTVYIPLGGIQIDNQVKQPIALGRIELAQINESMLTALQGKANAITKTMNYENKTLEAFVEEDNEHLSKSLLNKVCAIYHIVAEPSKAVEVAEAETQKVLNLLRYTIPDLHSKRSLDVRIDIDTLVPDRYHKTFVLSSSFFGKQWKRHNENYYISPQVMDYFEEVGVFAMSDILKKSPSALSDFETTLLRGIYWFGKSQTHADLENEFLNLTVCLEVFFTPPKGDPISNTIAEGTALWIGDNLEERKRIKQRIKQLYGVRSDVTHGSSKSIAERDIAHLRILTRRVVSTMIQRRSELNERADIGVWIEEKKLG